MTVYFGNGSGNPMADRRYELALQMAEWGDFAASADLLNQCIELAPDWPPLYYYLGEALFRTSQTALAREALSHYLTLDAEDKMGAAIRLSLNGAISPLQSLPPAYVRCLFEQYAPKFEKCLVENLSYCGPELLYRDITKIYQGPFENALDLGCGTGLAAAPFHKRTKRFTGIDIAVHMVNIAKTKNIYAALHTADINVFLDETADLYDLVLCADVLIYTGVTDKLFQQVERHLTGSGLFGFTVQTSETEGCILGQDHRFSHSKSYIDNSLALSGMTVLSCTNDVLRMDNNQPVQAMVFVCGKR